MGSVERNCDEISNQPRDSKLVDIPRTLTRRLSFLHITSQGFGEPEVVTLGWPFTSHIKQQCSFHNTTFTSLRPRYQPDAALTRLHLRPECIVGDNLHGISSASNTIRVISRITRSCFGSNIPSGNLVSWHLVLFHRAHLVGECQCPCPCGNVPPRCHCRVELAVREEANYRDEGTW